MHLDKTIYQPGETVWFTGYVLNRDRDLMQKQNTLYITLVDAVNRTPVIKQRFLIRSGIGKGSLALSDTLNSGDYWLIAYTNAWLESNNQPLFRQLISLKSPITPPFRILGQSVDYGSKSDNSIRVHYKFGTSYGGVAAGGKFTYTVFADHDSIGGGQQTIDPFGEAIIPVDTTTVQGRKLEITGTVNRDELSKDFILDVYPQTPIAVQTSNLDMARQQKTTKVDITPDSTEYHTRSGVTLHIRVTDSAGHPLQGIFSLSVASSKKIDWASIANIANFSLTANPLSTPAFTRTATSAPDFGYVTYLDKKPKKPVSLALMGNQLITFQTDSTGKFELPYPALVTPQGSTNYLSVTNNSQDDYKITICSKGDILDEQLASVHYPLNFSRPAVLSDSDELKMHTSPGMLRAALVKARVAQEYNAFLGEYQSRDCDQDYVCTHHHGPPQFPGILNCPDVAIHPCATTKPMEGGRYCYLSKADWHGRVASVPYVVYHCAVPSIPAFMVPLNPIVLNASSFPVQNYSSNDTLGSALQSTVYWNHMLSTNENGEATINFYTNDLTGKFVCILQGLSAEGAIFGKQSYMVTP